MLIPTIGFCGNCDEAITYYKEVIGAEVKTISHFRDAPPNSGMDMSLPPSFVMHSEVLMFGTLIIMTDGANKRMTDENFRFTLFLGSAEEVTSVFNRLADGGRIIDALAPQFWASLNGTVEDRFGIHWNILTSNEVV